MISIEAIALFMVFAILLVFCVLIYTSRPKTSKAEFISDMYRLQMKWSKRGGYSYAQAIGAVIEAVNEQHEEPQTEYGRNLAKSLMNNYE